MEETTTQTYSVVWETLSLRKRWVMWFNGIIEAVASFPQKDFPRITPRVIKRRPYGKRKKALGGLKATAEVPKRTKWKCHGEKSTK